MSWGQVAYNGSNTDKYLCNTYYPSLSTAAKSAIVPTSVTQYAYYCASTYYSSTHVSKFDYASKVAYGSSFERNIYTLGIEHIEEYFNHVFTVTDVRSLVTTTPTISGDYSFSLSSKLTNNNTEVAYWNNSDGKIDYYYATSTHQFWYRTVPVCRIDLSKISWEFN